MENLKETIERLVAREDLTLQQAQEAVEAVINGADPHQCAAFLVLLRAKGETPLEVAGMVMAMRKHMVPVPIAGTTIDIVGTGGDGANTLNFSTAASVVAASCGARVAKHGNRSVSSKSGSADVLQALGIKLDLEAAQVSACVEEASITFMFAPVFHPAMKVIMPVRKGLGVRTVFNILGPLLNPAGASRLLIGVYAPHLVELMARALFELKVEKAMVIHCGGLDELAPIAVADFAEVTPEGVTFGTLDPMELGFAKCTIADLAGGEAEQNAAMLRVLLNGDSPGPLEDTVVLNAGAALYVYGIAESVKQGCELARASIKSGAPLRTLDKWAAVCSRYV
ncbi:anthranilate phosphoribosyltransferase [Pavlovales sp. CCMP2436]|nr:anthranilate phosphoribosyltransferase [Pavlovales sp. CCMP2436]|mmetsp:Transcript_18843/g.48045  ORF Transcript_18843/g.48045 Transcript_18843/m.48045 type:complete len:339 (+) Transcript_18843:164-1180(+)